MLEDVRLLLTVCMFWGFTRRLQNCTSLVPGSLGGANIHFVTETISDKEEPRASHKMEMRNKVIFGWGR